MMFWLKQKKIVLDCFTTDQAAFDLAKPDYAAKFLPDWWKSIPHFVKDDGGFFKKTTARKCVGIIEQYKHGLMIPIWSDLNIEVGPLGTNEYRWQFSDNRSDLHSHPFMQLNNYITEKEAVHCKLLSPWRFRCKENVMWSWSSPTWNLLKNKNLTIVPGVSEFKYQHSTNINFFIFRKNEKFVVEIPFRTPIVHLMPLTTARLKIKHHLVTEHELKKLSLKFTSVSFIKAYSTFKNVLKEQEK